MALPFRLPLPLAEARPIDALPADTGGAAVEPKVDGWRIAIDTEHGQVFGRRGTNLSDRFSDLAEAARHLPPGIIDGELLAVNAAGAIEFTKIVHRSSRGPRAREDFTIICAAFDLLAHGDGIDLRPRRYHERRAELERLLRGAPPIIRPVPMTRDAAGAQAWLVAPGVEGLVLKPDSPYRPGKASGWLKWRERHTIDLVVIGVTATEPARQALVLAQPDPAGRLRPVAVTLPAPHALRAEIAPLLHPAGDVRELPEVVAGLPGRSHRVRYRPVRPEVVLEVQTDHVTPEFGRFRHNPRPVRVRYDVTPEDLAPAPA